MVDWCRDDDPASWFVIWCSILISWGFLNIPYVAMSLKSFWFCIWVQQLYSVANREQILQKQLLSGENGESDFYAPGGKLVFILSMVIMGKSLKGLTGVFISDKHLQGYTGKRLMVYIVFLFLICHFELLVQW